MSNYFTKYKKSATALALVFAVFYPTAISATQIHFQGQDLIDENADSLDAISGKFSLSERPIGGRGNNDPAQFVPIDVPYDLGRQTAKNDLQSVKNSVIQSPLLTYPELYEDHQNAFKQKIVTAYNNTPLRDCSNFLDRARDLSVKLFKVSQNHLSRGKNRNEWAYDDTLGGFFTFTLNNNQKVSILVRDLSVVLPLYSNHRHPDLRSMAPWVEPQDGVQLTADQRITGQFINRILSGEIPGNPLKQAIQYRLQNQNMSLENLTRHMRGEDIIQIQPRMLPYRGQVEADHVNTFKTIFFARDFPLRKFMPLFLKNVRDPDLLATVLKKQYDDMRELQHLINTASWNTVDTYANLIGYTESTRAIDRFDRSSFDEFMDKMEPVRKKYGETDQVRNSINRDSWDAVYNFANRINYSRDDVRWVYDRRGQRINYDTFLSKFDWQRKTYEDTKKVLHWLNTMSMPEVNDNAARIGFSNEDVSWVKGRRERGDTINFKAVLARKDILRKEYEESRELQFLINTTSWLNVFSYADVIGYPRENVTLINRAEDITFKEFLARGR